MTDHGIVTNIQKYTIHDGPGIRTEIFFKGCSLRCLWCSNPEGLNAFSEPGFYPSKCLGIDKCGYCRKVCPDPPANAHVCTKFKSEECRKCLKCADICPASAIKLWGKSYTVGDLMDIIMKDYCFYERSGGGVTLSGGEVLLQWDFAVELLKECRKNSVHTCVESALNVPTEHLEAVSEYTDLFIADIKHMDSAKHREITGAGNELILKNLRRIVELEKPLVLRTPIVIGYNADDENIRATGRFIRDELKGRILQYQLLPYRKMGTEKYDSLQIPYPMGDYAVPPREVWEPKLVRIADILRDEFGLPAVEGSGHKLPMEKSGQ